MSETIYVLEEERDRLDARLDELAKRATGAEDPTSEAMVMQIANEVEDRLRGVHNLISEYGADATVTIEALSAGDYARIEDRVEAKQVQSEHPGTKRGYRRNVTAAVALEDAPFIDDGDGFEDKLEAVADLPGEGVIKWLQARVDDASKVDEGNWKDFDERLAEQSQED